MKIRILYLFAIIYVFLPISYSCSGGNEAKTARQIEISKEILTSDFDKYYEIEKIESNELNTQLFLYISDTSKIKDVNDFLITKYNEDKKKYINIFYFNKKGIGKTYLKKQMKENVSEQEKDQLFKYFIAIYKFNPSNGYEQLSYEHK